MIGDRRLRALYRLAEEVDGEQLKQVRAAIGQRRAELERQACSTSAVVVADGPPAPEKPARWTPEPERFVPLGKDEVPCAVKRPGERQHRITARKTPAQ